MFFSRFEYLFYGKSSKTLILLKTVNNDGQINLIASKLNEFEMYYSNISVEAAEDNFIMISVKVTNNKDISSSKLIEELYKLQGIKYVQISD